MRILILNQPFYPDLVSSAQHAADLARTLASRGHEVRVIASRRGYDNPSDSFPAREDWAGVAIRRVWSTGFGKRSMLRRLADFATFLMGVTVALWREPGADAVIAMTTPPLIAGLGAWFVRLRGGRLIYWVMDLNPDQAIAAGILNPGSLFARAMKGVLHWTLNTAHRVIVLDRFMWERIRAKGVADERLVICPPWSHDDCVCWDEDGRHTFRSDHGLADKFVVMYSGNHSPCHPLHTLMNAAIALRADTRFAFCFVGGGAEYTRMQAIAAEHELTNVVFLPYQPLTHLAISLSAADAHVVVVGAPFVGIVHPCKIYNILRLGRPVLYIGPDDSHITDIFHDNMASALYHTQHGDNETLVRHILYLQSRQPEDYSINIDQYSQPVLLERMTSIVETCNAADTGRAGTSVTTVRQSVKVRA